MPGPKDTIRDSFRFKIKGKQKPTRSLKDSSSVLSTCQELEGWLRAVNKSSVPGKFKFWIYQHGISFYRKLWPLLVYEVPLSTVEALERKVSNCPRRWLGLPRSLSNIELYGNNTKLQLPLKSWSWVTQTQEALMHRDSRDPKVAQVGVAVKTRRKWSQNDLVGMVAHGRVGFGLVQTPRCKDSKGKERQIIFFCLSKGL